MEKLRLEKKQAKKARAQESDSDYVKISDSESTPGAAQSSSAVSACDSESAFVVSREDANAMKKAAKRTRTKKMRRA